MGKKILLTSFDIWLSHHQSNASDELLERVSALNSVPHGLTFLRKLPVDFELAPKQAIAKIAELEPDIIICCGMAECRQKLSIESRATCGEEVIHSLVDLDRLKSRLKNTEISHNAGGFVCEALYHSVLKYLRDSPRGDSSASRELATPCIFVHVPVLTPENSEEIIADFLAILSAVAEAKAIDCVEKV